MKQRDERMRLAATIRELELAHRLLVLTRKATHDVAGQVEERRVGYVRAKNSFGSS